MKILVDMNLSPNWTRFLISENISAVYRSQVGSVSAPDVEIMKYAAGFDYLVLTNDLDFGSILAVTHGGRPSVVQIRSDDLNPATIGPKVVAALRQSSHELAEGALLTIDPRRTRLRLLPLGSRK